MVDEIGVVGLGKMGSNVVRRLQDHGYRVVGFDVDDAAVDAAESEPAYSLEDVAGSLEPRRVFWVSVPAGEAVDETLDGLVPHLDEGDVVVDAGNSNYQRTRERHERLAEQSVQLVDAGCSGGPQGALEGLSIMAGGEPEAVDVVEPVLRDMSEEDGYGYFGPPGAGHYVKMVHNGVEYAIMQALGEGFELLAEGDYDDVDLEKVARVWSNGSVVESQLVEMCESAFEKHPRMEEVKGYVPDSGEGRWTVETAIEQDVPATGIAQSLFARYRSRVGDEGTFADKVISALRHEFGGHDVETED